MSVPEAVARRTEAARAYYLTIASGDERAEAGAWLALEAARRQVGASRGQRDRDTIDEAVGGRWG